MKTHPYKKEQQTAQAQQKPKDDASILGNFKGDLIIVSARGGSIEKKAKSSNKNCNCKIKIVCLINQ